MVSNANHQSWCDVLNLLISQLALMSLLCWKDKMPCIENIMINRNREETNGSCQSGCDVLSCSYHSQLWWAWILSLSTGGGKQSVMIASGTNTAFKQTNNLWFCMLQCRVALYWNGNVLTACRTITHTEIKKDINRSEIIIILTVQLDQHIMKSCRKVDTKAVFQVLRLLCELKT